jgi:ATP-dependent DNA helicase RecQ
MADVSTRRIRFILDVLVERGLLFVDAGKFPTVRFTPQAGEFLRNRETLVVKVPKENESERRARLQRERAQAAGDAGADSRAHAPFDEVLFQRLKELRARVAAEEGMPAYIVFHDRTLREMCRHLPSTHEELLEVSGVGDTKAERYGDAFLAEIAAFRAEQASESAE